MQKTGKNIAIIGSNSMVGSRYCELNTKDNLIQADLKGKINVDITDNNSVIDFFNKNLFETVILFSAYTDVDSAEKQRNNKNQSCWQINVEGSQNVFKACLNFNRKLIFISTDFVFDGQNGPYGENDPRGGNLEKVSWYGMSKIAAEENCEIILNNYLILRISYPYRGKFTQKLDFARQIIKRYDNETLYPMFTDQIITPTFIDDIAPAIDLLLQNNASGIYHLASPKKVSPFEFAKELISTLKKDTDKINNTSINDYLKNPDSTPIPPKSGLKVKKISKEGFIPTNWQKGIEEIYRESNGELI